MPVNAAATAPRTVLPRPPLPGPAAVPAPPAARVDTFTPSTSSKLSAAEQRRRYAGMERFVREMAKELELKRVPTLSINPKLEAAGHYDERSHHISVGPGFLSMSGDRARKILAHEMEHAWQYETGLLRWNMDHGGLYLDAPKGPLWKTLVNPLKLAQLIGYALQPSELHAELTRITRGALRMLPDSPW